MLLKVMPTKSAHPCHTKIGPTGLILVEKFAKIDPPDHFATTINSTGPDLAAKSGSPVKM